MKLDFRKTLGMSLHVDHIGSNETIIIPIIF